MRRERALRAHHTHLLPTAERARHERECACLVVLWKLGLAAFQTLQAELALHRRNRVCGGRGRLGDGLGGRRVLAGRRRNGVRSETAKKKATRPRSRPCLMCRGYANSVPQRRARAARPPRPTPRSRSTPSRPLRAAPAASGSGGALSRGRERAKSFGWRVYAARSRRRARLDRN